MLKIETKPDLNFIQKAVGHVLCILKIIILMFCYIVLAIISTPAWLFKKNKSIELLTYYTRLWGLAGAKILGLKIKIHGDIKKASGLIVSNHVSYMDIITIASVFNLRFAAKKEVVKWPILGWIVAVSKPILVNRKLRQDSINTMDEFVWTLSNGINMVAFPEGTTTNGECDLVLFKSTSFEAAIQAESKVSPILLRYKDDQVSWALEDTTPLIIHAWRLFKKIKIEVDIYILDPIPSKKNFDRKNFCNEVYNVMNDRYTELRNQQHN